MTIHPQQYSPLGFQGISNQIIKIRELSAYLFILPALLLLLILFIVPVISVLAIALTDWQLGMRSANFVGITNFSEVLSDGAFWNSLKNTLVFMAIVLPITVGLGLFIALLIESGKSFRTFYRAVHFVPYMATMAASAIAWEALLHPTIGLVNQIVIGLGFEPVNWLRNEGTALVVLAIISIWQNLGLAMVLFLAGLKTIPEDVYHAAEIDGISASIDKLISITLPLLLPVLTFVVVIVSLRALETFDTIQILTQGGPANSTEMLLFTVYRESFEYLRTGYGASVATIFMVIVFLLSLLQIRITQGKRKSS